MEYYYWTLIEKCAHINYNMKSLFLFVTELSGHFNMDFFYDKVNINFLVDKSQIGFELIWQLKAVRCTFCVSQLERSTITYVKYKELRLLLSIRRDTLLPIRSYHTSINKYGRLFTSGSRKTFFFREYQETCMT